MRAERWLPALLLALCSGCQDPARDVALVGTLERTLIEIAAPVSERIEEISCERGLRVAAGDTLVRLDSALAEADVAAAEAALAGARARDLVSRQDFERARRLGQRDVASQQQLDRARLARDEAVTRLRESEARLSAARKRLADLTLVAPSAGVVDQIPFDRGERVPAGAVLVVILADGEPWVRVWLPERALASVRPGSPAEVTLDGVAGTLRGRVLDVGREPAFTPHYALTERERAHLVYETRVAVENAPASLRAGIPAQVSFRLDGPPPAPP